jgi:hypothetical protein
LAGSAKVLGLLALCLGSALSYNGYLLYRAFRYGGTESFYRVVLKSDFKSTLADLRSVNGVAVSVTDKVYYKRHNTGRWWLGEELDNEIAKVMQSQLRALHYNAIIEQLDQGRSVVHLPGDYPSESAASRARRGVSSRVTSVVTLRVVPAFHAEKTETEVVDLTVPDSEHLHAVQAVAARHNLNLESTSPE